MMDFWNFDAAIFMEAAQKYVTSHVDAKKVSVKKEYLCIFAKIVSCPVEVGTNCIICSL